MSYRQSNLNGPHLGTIDIGTHPSSKYEWPNSQNSQLTSVCVYHCIYFVTYPYFKGLHLQLEARQFFSGIHHPNVWNVCALCSYPYPTIHPCGILLMLASSTPYNSSWLCQALASVWCIQLPGEFNHYAAF